jgi:hypothetical protein
MPIPNFDARLEPGTPPAMSDSQQAPLRSARTTAPDFGRTGDCFSTCSDPHLQQSAPAAGCLCSVCVCGVRVCVGSLLQRPADSRHPVAAVAAVEQGLRASAGAYMRRRRYGQQL